MDLRATLACAAGVCLGVALFAGFAGEEGRLNAAPLRPPAGARPAATTTPTLLVPREPGAAGEPGSDAAAGGPAAGPQAADDPVAPAILRRSRVFDALDGVGGQRLGGRVVVLSELPEPPAPLPAARLYVIDADPVGPLREAVRDARPAAQVAVAGFRPGAGGADPAAAEADAATLASVDALALSLPAGADAAAVERFCEEAGRHGRRVYALIPVPRTPGELPAWRAGFAGATAAGVGVVLTGTPGGDPAVEAAWRADVAAFAALTRRLAGIAYD